MRQKINYCKETNKFCYSSQAKAVRAKNRYEDINRVYHCDSCNSWHTTKMRVGIAKIHNIDIKERGKKPSKKELLNRLEYLRKKMDE